MTVPKESYFARFTAPSNTWRPPSAYIPKDVPAKFIIDARSAGSAPVVVEVTDANSNSIDVKLFEKPDGTIEGEYTSKSGKVTKTWYR